MNLVETDRLADKIAGCKPERRMFESVREHRIALLTWERVRGQVLIFIHTHLEVNSLPTFSTQDWLRRAGGR